MREREEQLAREQKRLRQLEEQAAGLALQALEAARAMEQQQAAAAEEAAAERLRVRAAKAELLPQEPEADAPHVRCLFRLPDGGRISRRWCLEQRLQSLYDFVDSEGGGGLAPHTYRLVAQYPRRVLEASQQTLGQAGFAAGQQEALLIEATGG